MRSPFAILLRSMVLPLALGACTGATNTDAATDIAATDLVQQDIAASDAPSDTPADAPPCETDVDCDDGVFCNGAERCSPGTSGADARGCVPANPATPCLASQTCDETMDRCDTACGMAADADGDGHRASACGGDDCDDNDPMRFPGNPEVCDLDSSHDEDCDPATFGMRDMDGDGTSDARCCNPSADGMSTNCGTDCDDTRPDVHPGATEICDGVDSNCNGLLDGPMEDVDMDGHANNTCAGTGGSDCDDSNADVYVGAPELCDGIDNDCDGRADAVDGGMTCASIRLALGSFHSCAVKMDGTSVCWGANAAGQLGDMTTTQRTAPVSVRTTEHATTNGAGYANSCIRTTRGAVMCWGDNHTFQLSDSRIVGTMSSTPVAITGITDASAVSVGGGNGLFIGNFAHICAVRSRGYVACWGDNTSGQLGDGTTTSRATPLSPTGLTGVVQVDTGVAFSCAVTAVGTARSVRCWGANNYGQVGTGSTATTIRAPATVSVTSPVQIALGAVHACVVRSTGAISCWGSNVNGQLGNGVSGSGMMRTTPGDVPGITDAVQVVAGATHTCARRMTGEVVCWGANDVGQIGNGTTSPSTHPVAVTGLTDAVDIAAGANHNCARRIGGQIVCWGGNLYGQLGDGSTINRLTPTPVMNLP